MKKQSFTLVELMIVVAIIGLLAALALPTFIRSRVSTQREACINNLRMLRDGAALLRWDDNEAEISLETVNDYIQQDTTSMHCPADSSAAYEFQAVGEYPYVPSCTNHSVDDHILPSHRQVESVPKPPNHSVPKPPY